MAYTYAFQIIADHRLFYRRTTTIFRVICFLLAAYMAVRLIDRFLENRDATSITYRRYSDTVQDRYPTYSMCFQGTRFHWNNDLGIFSAYELTYSDYERLLIGETPIRYQYNLTSRLYTKTLTFMGKESFVNLTNFYVQFSNLLRSAEFEYENSSHTVKFETQEDQASVMSTPFHVGYHTPEMICFTRDSDDSVGSIRLHDDMNFNIPILNYSLYWGTTMKLFVHYPGQLMRSMDNPSFSSLFSEYQYWKMLEIKLSQGTVLRKRSDSIEKCINETDTHDQFLMKEVSRKFDCVPPYWIDILRVNMSLTECRSPQKLRDVYDYIKDTRRMAAFYEPPCLGMYNAVTYYFQPMLQNDPMMKVVYKDKFYQEIQYVKDFNFESFWSGIGGFLGMFLGYSMMQFPELLGN